jgi:HAD superfamily hydrolase (TIGR01509 family)
MNLSAFKDKKRRQKPMKKTQLDVNGILFDLDGTILDTKPAYIAAAEVAFKTFGMNPPLPAIALEIPKRIEQKQPLPEAVTAGRETFLKVYLRAFYEASATKTQPFPNVSETLGILCQKAKMALITMRFTPRDVVVAELKQYDLDKYFAYVVTASDTCKPKPSPEALIKAVKAMAVDLCTCVIVGDSVVDIRAGKAAGIKTVAVLTGLYSRGELLSAKPDFLVNDISRLPDLLKQS